MGPLNDAEYEVVNDPGTPGSGKTPTGSLIDRMIRAAKLDADLYEEVEADRSATGQALLVVILSSLAGGVGFIGQMGIAGLGFGLLANVTGWFIWAYIVYVIGAKLFPEPTTRSDHGELLRTLGFSSSPGLIRVLGLIPGLGWISSTVASVWMLAAMVVAVRQALDYRSTWRAVGVSVLGMIVYTIVMMLWLLLIGGGVSGAV